MGDLRHDKPPIAGEPTGEVQWIAVISASVNRSRYSCCSRVIRCATSGSLQDAGSHQSFLTAAVGISQLDMQHKHAYLYNE